MNRAQRRLQKKRIGKIRLIDYQVDTDWIKEKILDMKKTIDLDQVPKRTPHCENCAYLKQGSNFFLNV